MLLFLHYRTENSRVSRDKTVSRPDSQFPDMYRPVRFDGSIIHFISGINNGSEARGSMIVHMQRRSRIVFFFFLLSFFRRACTVAVAVEAGKRRARTKERMHPSSVIHCPGCTPYVFPCRGASRIIQIIASEMIISDDHATVDLAALK